jgi:RNA polymerase sigma-B factor
LSSQPGKPYGGRSVGSVEDDLDTVDNRLVLADLFDGLASRERRIIALRYFGELTQSKIAERVGVSQMHVSRLLRQGLANLRTAASEHALASSR